MTLKVASRFAHSVFFTLKDACETASVDLAAACQKYLSDHPGTLYFAVGRRAVDYGRPVNDQQFDVALHLTFSSESDHDRYQQSERHQQFLAENENSWSQVRVFDAFV